MVMLLRSSNFFFFVKKFRQIQKSSLLRSAVSKQLLEKGKSSSIIPCLKGLGLEEISILDYSPSMK